MDGLKRAAENIDNLEAFIEIFNEKTTGVDGPTKALQGIQKVPIGRVPVEIVSAADAAIVALLDTLKAQGGSIDVRVTRNPPKWWREVRTFMRYQRHECGSTHKPLIDAFDILDRHIGEDSLHLAGLVLLRMDLDQKIERLSARHGFRAPGDPHPDNVTFIFNPKINANTGDPFHELVEKISIDPIPCTGFLRQAASEVRCLLR